MCTLQARQRRETAVLLLVQPSHVRSTTALQIRPEDAGERVCDLFRRV